MSLPWNPSNSLWPSDAMWWHRFRSKLSQVMACCYQHQAITRTNVYLSSIRSNGIHLMAKFRGNTKDIIHKNMFESFIFRITATSVRRQWVNRGQTLESHRLLRFTLKDHINIPICMTIIIAVDDLAIQGSRTSSAVSPWHWPSLPQDILGPAQYGLIRMMLNLEYSGRTRSIPWLLTVTS